MYDSLMEWLWSLENVRKLQTVTKYKEFQKLQTLERLKKREENIRKKWVKIILTKQFF